MTNTLRLPVVLLADGSVSTTGNWYFLDYKWDIQPHRPISVEVVSGDTVYLEVTPDPQYNSDSTPASVSTICTVSAFTANATTLLDGGWTRVRARKTGTTGPVKVKGVL